MLREIKLHPLNVKEKLNFLFFICGLNFPFYFKMYFLLLKGFGSRLGEYWREEKDASSRKTLRLEPQGKCRNKSFISLLNHSFLSFSNNLSAFSLKINKMW